MKFCHVHSIKCYIGLSQSVLSGPTFPVCTIQTESSTTEGGKVIEVICDGM